MDTPSPLLLKNCISKGAENPHFPDNPFPKLIAWYKSKHQAQGCERQYFAATNKGWILCLNVQYSQTKLYFPRDEILHLFV